MTVVVAVDVVLVFRVLGGGRFRQQNLMIKRNEMIIKHTKMIGTVTPILIDTLDANADAA